MRINKCPGPLTSITAQKPLMKTITHTGLSGGIIVELSAIPSIVVMIIAHQPLHLRAFLDFLAAMNNPMNATKTGI